MTHSHTPSQAWEDWGGWANAARSGLTRASLPLPELAHIDRDADTYADDPHRDVLVRVQTVRVHSAYNAQETEKKACTHMYMYTEIRKETSSGCRPD